MNLPDFAKGLSDQIKRYVKDALDDRDRRLEARIKALEDRNPLSYAGTWDEDRTYHLGECVTASGSLWIVNIPGIKGVRPGQSEAFKLIVKKGSL